MSPTPSNEPTQAKSATAQGLSAIWGLVLDHLVDKHAQAAAEAKINPEGGVARTSAGVVVTSKEMYLKVLLNADDNYNQRRISEADGANVRRNLPRHGLGS